MMNKFDAHAKYAVNNAKSQSPVFSHRESNLWLEEALNTPTS
jgi:hypothetical protein